jgi:hypothetical protein
LCRGMPLLAAPACRGRYCRGLLEFARDSEAEKTDGKSTSPRLYAALKAKVTLAALRSEAMVAEHGSTPGRNSNSTLRLRFDGKHGLVLTQLGAMLSAGPEQPSLRLAVEIELQRIPSCLTRRVRHRRHLGPHK